MIGLLLALYPAPWRRRYEEEFRAVLESRALGPFDVADILLGALDARARMVRLAGAADNHGGRNIMLRIGGIGAIAGGLLWVGGFVGGSVIGGETPLWLSLLLLGTIGLLLALVGLSAFQAHREPRLAWAALLLPGVASVVSLVGLYGMIAMPDTDIPMIAGYGPWSIWAIGMLATLVGCVLFGVVTYRAAVLSRSGAVGLTSSSIVLLVLALGLESGPAAGGVAVVLAIALFAFAGSWALLGLGALRRGPIRAIAPA